MIRLALLCARRALPFYYLLALLAVLVLAATRDWGASPEVLRALGGDASSRAAARAGAYICAVLCVLPPLVARAGATLPRWRRADRDWIATRAASPLACLAMAWCGPLVAGAALLAAFLAAGELAAGGSGPCLRRVRTLAHEPVRLVSGARDGAVTLAGLAAEDLEPGDVLRIRLVPVPGRGPSADVRLAARAGGQALGSAQARVVDRGAIDLLLSAAGAGPVALALARGEEGAFVLLPRDSVELLRAGGRERGASAAAFLRALLALAAGSALALGLGAWMRGALAVLLVLAAWVLCWSSGLGAERVPGAELFLVLRLLGDGVAPAWPGPALLACALALAALGLALARLGWRAEEGA